MFVFLIWILCNLFIGYVMSQFRKYNMSVFLIIVAYTLLIFQLVKLLGMIIYRISLCTSQDTDNNGDHHIPEQPINASNGEDSEASPDISSK